MLAAAAQPNVQQVVPKTQAGPSELQHEAADRATQQAAIEVEDSVPKGKEKEKWCFRCRNRGHKSADCVAEFFCQVCESDEHVAANCPIKKKPRPVAHVVSYAHDNLGFYHIPHAPYVMTKKDGITALIKVIGECLSEEE